MKNENVALSPKTICDVCEREIGTVFTVIIRRGAIMHKVCADQAPAFPDANESCQDPHALCAHCGCYHDAHRRTTLQCPCGSEEGQWSTLQFARIPEPAQVLEAIASTGNSEAVAALHTPGPWKQCPGPDYEDAEHRRANQLYVQTESGSVIARIHRRDIFGKVQDTDLANARLIAAAPDMHDLTHRITSLNRDAGEIGAGMLAQLIDEARRILAKLKS